ncbi:MAG: peroxisomal targeting signal 2 receptor [Chrysothrix sp. TS-e1954]|nr:MAG: peroxisomal targeting signal 2 receptor [Chrysothrix sp. TS-e1954]
MLSFRTPGFKGFGVKYSPYFDNRIAVATGQNYGIVGNGRLFILALTSRGIQVEKTYDTQDALYDLAWSESNENQVLVATGDGCVKLFDVNVPKFPIANWESHGREVFSVHWNQVSKNTFLSSSWDGTVKIYNPNRDPAITVLPMHNCVYSAQFSPHENGVVSAVGSDSKLRLFDLRTPASASNHLMLTMPINASPKSHMGSPPGKSLQAEEVLTHDWNKYRPTVVATAGVDRLIRTFDLRNPTGGPIAVLPGHDYGIRKLSWSPHLSDVLLSASYDMSCRVWTDGTAVSGNGAQGGRPMRDPMAYGGGRQMGVMRGHTEFCMGVDWCLFGAEGWCASTAWDEQVLVWDVRTVMGG